MVDLTIVDSFKSCTSNDLKEKFTFTMAMLDFPYFCRKYH